MKSILLARGFLISAIVTGIGTVAVTQFMVRPHIKTIVAEREAHKNEWQRERDRASQLTMNLTDAQEKLATAERNLAETRGQFAAATEEHAKQARRAETLQQGLDTTQRELKEAQQDLAAWKGLTISVDRLQSIVASEKQLRERTTMLQEQLEALRRENRRLNELLAGFVRPDDDPPMPGVQGTIVAVDPKWNFVVLDVGEKAGAKPRGVFMVSREGRLIGKVKVASVNSDRSIANVVPGWQLDAIMEGDRVIF